jgi:tRNA-modifying protein YgfZ
MAATDTEQLSDQHRVLRDDCGLVDRSQRGKLLLSGRDAVQFLEGQVTNELSSLEPGQGRYAAFLTHKGKMLGDLRILAAADDLDGPPSCLLLDTERVALQALFDMIRRYKLGYQVELIKRTLQSTLLSLIGPSSATCLRRAGVTDSLGSLVNEHAHLLTQLAGVDVRVVRTADGFDLLLATENEQLVTQALLQAGVRQVSEQAAEILRVEHGIPRYGLDIDESTIPQEAALNERAVSFTKGCYVGQETVARLHWKGKPNRHLRGLRLTAPVSSGEEIYLGQRVIGRLGSVVLSPAEGYIALALLRREAAPQETVRCGPRGVSAQVVELPFAR